MKKQIIYQKSSNKISAAQRKALESEPESDTSYLDIIEDKDVKISMEESYDNLFRYLNNIVKYFNEGILLYPIGGIVSFEGRIIPSFFYLN